jgi:hypothetical protein
MIRDLAVGVQDRVEEKVGLKLDAKISLERYIKFLVGISKLII